MATGLDLIKGGLRRCNSYQSGEPIAAPDEQDCLDTMNDLFDSWSVDKLYIFGSNENILQFTGGKNQYKVGNPTNTSLGQPNFTGTVGAIFTASTATNVLTVTIVSSGIINVGDLLIDSSMPANTKIASFGSGTGGTGTYNLTTSPGTLGGHTVSTGSAIITGITNMPANLIANATLSDLANVIAPGTTVSSVGSTTITMSAQSVGSSTGADTLSYTIPGDFAIPRPLRITDGFTRISSLDFTIDVTMSQKRFLEILYKAQPGPWPTVAWYNPLMPYGILNVFPTPSSNAEVHLFTDTILTNLTATQTFILPQGYARAIKWCLAKEFCAEFGYPLTEAIKTHAKESLDMIKALNAQPAPVARYDRELMRGGRVGADWIMHGGFGGTN